MMQEKYSEANEDIKIPIAIKDRLKELSLVISDTTQLYSKTERTAFVFMTMMLLRDYVVFSTISTSSNMTELNNFIDGYKDTKLDPIAEAARENNYPQEQAL